MKMKNHNYYFKVYLINEDNPLRYLHLYRPIELFHKIQENYIDNDDVYNKNIKDVLQSVFPEVIHLIDIDDCLNNENIGICMISEYEYRENNKDYDNWMKFVEYINSEKAFKDKNTNITEDILKSNNFKRIDEEWERKLYGDEYFINDFSSWRISTINIDEPRSSFNINLDNGNTNNGALWHVHVDDHYNMTVGTADISTVWQFNSLMELLESKFRL